jgi:hypothetical protein
MNNTEGSWDSLSVGPVAKLLNVSSARLKQLARAGEPAQVDTDSDGVMRLQRKAVLARYETKRRQQTGLKKMVDGSERAGINALE